MTDGPTWKRERAVQGTSVSRMEQSRVHVWVLCSSIYSLVCYYVKTGSDPAYANESYYVTTGVTKDIALAEMQEKIRIVEKWMSRSGLRVNLKKTKMVIFYRMDQAIVQSQLGAT